jgi:hypothetical protein
MAGITFTPPGPSAKDRKLYLYICSINSKERGGIYMRGLKPDSDTVWRIKYGRIPFSRFEAELLLSDPVAKYTAPLPERWELERWEWYFRKRKVVNEKSCIRCGKTESIRGFICGKCWSRGSFYKSIFYLCNSCESSGILKCPVCGNSSNIIRMDNFFKALENWRNKYPKT